MRRILYILYQPYKWLIFLPILVASTFVFAALAVIFAALVNPRVASIVGGTGWARFNSFLTPMLVRVSGREHVDERTSYVIVANHQSQYDIFVLYGWLGVDFRWVMKKELRRIPALGYSCHKIGHIFIDRSNTQAAMSSINAAKERIVNGTSVLFFPEGTRSPDGHLGRFKRGAFKFALDLELPILPVTIVGTRHVLPAGSTRLFPGRARLVIHEPVSTAGVGEKDIPELVQQVRSAIASALPEETAVAEMAEGAEHSDR